MRIYKTTKQVLSFTNHLDKFFPGITSNTLTAPYNAFLNIHGRVVAVFDQVRIDDERMLICIEPAFKDELFAHIQKYVMLSGVDVQMTDYDVYFDLDTSYTPADDEYTIGQKKGQLILSTSDISPTVTDDEFIAFRLDHTIAVQGIDFHHEMILNISPDQFTSFTKGCYLGQEVVSKVHNRAKPTWKLVVKNEADCLEKELLKMTSRYGGRGFVFIKNE